MCGNTHSQKKKNLIIHIILFKTYVMLSRSTILVMHNFLQQMHDKVSIYFVSTTSFPEYI